MKHPKQKGNSHELKVAKALSEWSNHIFRRTPMSGALHWSNDKRVISDVVPEQQILDIWPFSIECKNVENNWEFSSFIDGTSQTLKEHWVQCWEDSQRENLIPMLIITKNYRDIYVIIKEDTYELLDINPSCIVKIENQEWSLVIIKFKELLELITFDELIKRCNKQN